jgi:hypothetical protein
MEWDSLQEEPCSLARSLARAVGVISDPRCAPISGVSPP